MTLSIYWTEPAHHDLRRLRTWIEHFSVEKAPKEALRILTSVRKLQEFPRLGKRIPVPDHNKNEELREIFVPPYVVRYTVDSKSIRIIRLRHYREDQFN